MSLALSTPLTVTTFGTEDENGVAPETTYPVLGMIIAITEASRAAVYGNTPAGTINVFLDPAGFGTTWSVKPGDTVSDGTQVVKITTVTPVSNPRTGELKIVEASGAL